MNNRYSPVAILLILMSVILVTTSCKKSWLNPAPENTLILGDSTFFHNENAVKFVNSCYANLNEWDQHVFSWIGMSSITSDDADKGSDPGDTGADKDQMDNFGYTAASLSPSEVWGANYRGIGRCNQAIANIPKFASLPEADKNRLIGEAKFLRAYYYFNLVRCYGGVPLVDHLVDPKDVNDFNTINNRATTDKVYALIESDLNFAAANLPDRDALSASDIGRATKGAAIAYSAKVHMYEKHWSESLSAAETVINSGKYHMEADYATIWRQSTENGPESIFEVQAENGGSGWATGGYFVCQGARGGVDGGYGGWGFNTPTADLEAAYEAGDVRKAATMYFPGETLWDGAKVKDPQPNPRYNYKSYVSQTMESNYDDWWTNKNIRIMRYAEVLLIAAEAANELGQTGPAAGYLNQVRTRAGLPNTTAASQSDLRTAIWKERRVELAMEHDRFFDLVRTGRAATVLANKGFMAGKHELFPIPQNAIDISGGRLTQNPGY